MGGDRSCLWLAVLLVLPFLDARTVKIVPAETKIITTDDGATHEISRYIVIPDDETNSLDTDTIHDLKHNYAKNSATDQEFKESKLINAKNEISGDSAIINSKTNTETQSVKPGLVKITIKNAQETDSKAKQTVPTNESKMKIFVSGNNGGGKLLQSNIEGVLNAHANQELLKAGIEELEKTAGHDKAKETSNEHNIERETKIMYNPAKINNVKYTELPINWEYTKPVTNGHRDHQLLKTIAINKTFTLPGKRGRFKLIYEDDDDDDDEYSNVLEKTIYEHSTNPSAHKNMDHSVDANENQLSKLTNIESNNQQSDTSTNLEKNGLDTDAKNGLDTDAEDKFRFRSLVFKTQNSAPNGQDNTNSNSYSEKDNYALALDQANQSNGAGENEKEILGNKTDEDSERATPEAVNLVVEKSNNPISSPLDSSVDIHHLNFIKEYETGPSGNRHDNEHKWQSYYTHFPDNDKSDLFTKHVNEKSTFNHNKFINYSVKTSVKKPILDNNSNKDSTAFEQIEPKSNNTTSTIHSKNITTNAKVTHVTKFSHENHMQVLPLKTNTIITDPSQVERLKTINTTKTGHSITEITSSKDHSYFALPNHDNPQDKNPIINSPSVETIYTTEFKNINSGDVIPTVTKSNDDNKVTEINRTNSPEIKEEPIISIHHSLIKPAHNFVDKSNVHNFGIKDQYKPNEKQITEHKVIKEKNDEDVTSSLAANKSIDKTSRVTSEHKIDSENEAANDHSNSQVLRLNQSNMNGADSNKKVQNFSNLVSANQHAVNVKENTRAPLKEKVTENITDSSPSNKNFVQTNTVTTTYKTNIVPEVHNSNSSKNIALEIENNQNPNQIFSQDLSNVNITESNAGVGNMNILGIGNQYEVHEKENTQNTQLIITSKKENLKNITKNENTPMKNKNNVKISKATSKHETKILNNADSSESINPKAKNYHSNDQVLGQDQNIIEKIVEPNVHVKKHHVVITNKYEVDEKENPEPKTAPTNKAIVQTNKSIQSQADPNVNNELSSINIDPEIKTDQGNNQVHSQNQSKKENAASNTHVENISVLGIGNHYDDDETKNSELPDSEVNSANSNTDITPAAVNNNSNNQFPNNIYDFGINNQHEKETNDPSINIKQDKAETTKKTENNQVQDQDPNNIVYIVKPNTDINNHYVQNQYEEEEKENKDPKVNMKQDSLEDVTNSLSTNKNTSETSPLTYIIVRTSPVTSNIVRTSPVTSKNETEIDLKESDDIDIRIVPDTKNIDRNKQVPSQNLRTNRVELNTKNETEPDTRDVNFEVQASVENENQQAPSNQSNVLPDHPELNLSDSISTHHDSLATYIKNVQDPITHDGNDNKRELFVQITAPTDEFNYHSPALNDDNKIFDENTSIPPSKEKLNPTDTNNENQTYVEQSKIILVPLPADEIHEFDGNNIEEDHKDQKVSNDSSDEDERIINDISDSVIEPQNNTEQSETNKNNVNKAQNKTGPYNPNNYYITDSTYHYFPEYLYRNLDSQTNKKDSTSLEGIDNQYLQNLREYLIFSNTLAEYNQKYQESLGKDTYSNVNRNAWIIKQLQNFGILDKLTPEQLKYLIKHVKQHEPLDTPVDNKHQNIYNVHNLPMLAHIAHQNQVIDPNKYYFAAPYYNIFDPAAVREHNTKLLRDGSYLKQYLLKDYDATINEVIRDLNDRILSIINYLRSHGVSDSEIINFVIEAKKQFTSEVLQSEYQKAYIDAGLRIDKNAQQLLRSNLRSYISYNC